MDTRIAVALALGGLTVWIGYQNPALGGAIAVGVGVVTLLLVLLK